MVNSANERTKLSILSQLFALLAQKHAFEDSIQAKTGGFDHFVITILVVLMRKNVTLWVIC